MMSLNLQIDSCSKEIIKCKPCLVTWSRSENLNQNLKNLPFILCRENELLFLHKIILTSFYFFSESYGGKIYIHIFIHCIFKETTIYLVCFAWLLRRRRKTLHGESNKRQCLYFIRSSQLPPKSIQVFHHFPCYITIPWMYKWVGNF